MFGEWWLPSPWGWISSHIYLCTEQDLGRTVLGISPAPPSAAPPACIPPPPLVIRPPLRQLSRGALAAVPPTLELPEPMAMPTSDVPVFYNNFEIVHIRTMLQPGPQAQGRPGEGQGSGGRLAHRLGVGRTCFGGNLAYVASKAGPWTWRM